MKNKWIVLVLTIICTTNISASDDEAKYCDSLASIAADVARERINGSKFSDVLARIDKIDSSDGMKVLLKGMASDVYKNKFTPEEAYSDMIWSCMRSVSQD